MSRRRTTNTGASRLFQAATYGYSLGYLLLAAVCLVRWGTPEPWSSFDLYVIGYLALRALASFHSIITARNALANRRVRQEWWATNSDPGGIPRVMVLMGLDLAVFFLYAHGHPVGGLERPSLRACGLLLYAASTSWQAWTDEYLARFFSGGPHSQPPMNQGPYRFVRHPRYAGALAGKVAFALIFANVLGWLMVLAWGALLIRKLREEERHLKSLFGPRYETYQHATAKLLPGVY
jgi:protein-S-isoprenylcysteine O-methyltransferase Ste14